MKEKETTPRDSIIKVMPDQKTLEAFLEGMHGPVTVYFDTERGEFIQLRPDSSQEANLINIPIS